MLGVNFSDVINKLDEYYRYRTPCLGDAHFEQRLLNFINTVRSEMDPGVHPFVKPLNFDSKTLINSATALMVYCQCQGLASLAKEQDEKLEIDFYLSNPRFVEAVNRNNLFAIHTQLIYLANLIQRYKEIQQGKIAPNETIINGLSLYIEKIKKLNGIIGKLEDNKVGIFKNYLQFLAYYVLIEVCLVKQDRNSADLDLAQNYLMKARVEARVAKKMEGTRLADESIIDFYTFGKNLFARTKFKSFDEAENYLMNEVPLAFTVVTAYFEVAQNRVNELNKSTVQEAPQPQKTPSL